MSWKDRVHVEVGVRKDVEGPGRSLQGRRKMPGWLQDPEHDLLSTRV